MPVTSERVLISDAEKHHLDATPHPIALDDIRKVLSAGCPGPRGHQHRFDTFSDVGRDGVFNAAEGPSGRHGRHAMLIVGLHRQLLHHQELLGRAPGATKDTATSPRTSWPNPNRTWSRCW